MPSYLRKQHNVYWARFQVPADVRDAFGKSEVWENLNTSDRTQAAARAARRASEFRARVLEARGRKGTIEQDALFWAAHIAKEDEHRDVVIEAAIRAAADRLIKGGAKKLDMYRAKFGDIDLAEALTKLGGPQARTFVDIAIVGRQPLRLFIDGWHAQREGEVEPKTAHMDAKAVRQFVDRFHTADEVTPKAVAEWAEERRTKHGVAPATVSRELSGLRSFWAYLVAREAAPDTIDPFAKLRLKKRTKAAAEVERRPFANKEVANLYRAALKEDRQLADLIALAAYTGARIEELCMLTVDDIKRDMITVRNAKSAAGNRTLPVHPKLAPTIRRLIDGRKVGFLLEGLKADRFGDRSPSLGKRFGALKTRLGFGPEKVFHSIRRTVISQLEAAGVQENVTADIVGHQKPRITYGVYSGRGGAAPLMRSAIAKIKYPPPLG